MPNLFELRDAKYEPFNPDQDMQDWIMNIYHRFDIAKDERQRPQPWLGNRSLEEYWADAERRWLALPYDGDKDWWQSTATKPITRQKCTAIIAHIVEYYLQPNIRARGKNPARRMIAESLKNVVEVANKKDKYFRKMIGLATDATVYGTAFVQEDYVCEKAHIKDTRRGKLPTEDGDYEWKKKLQILFEGPKSKILSPFDVYLGNIFEPDIQSQPYIFRRRVAHYKTAEAEFGQMKNWKYVVPGRMMDTDEEDQNFQYHARVSDDLEDEQVEILYYQCRQDDEIGIIINGIPMTEIGEPNPYDHKKYNLAKAMYSTFNNQVAYGKGLPDLLQHEQDNLDTLYRMIIDGEFMRLMPPLLAKGRDVITSDVLQPSAITTVDTETEIVPLIPSRAVGNEYQLLQIMEGSMDKSSIDPSQQGQMATGARPATQILEAKYGTQRILGLFSYMIAFMIEDFTELRLSNVLQFWAREKRYVDSEEGLVALQGEFVLEDTRLKDGSMGSKIVRFSEKLPASQEVYRERMQNEMMGNKVEIVYLDPKKVRDLDFYIEYETNPSERMTPQLQKALQLEFYDRFNGDPMINQMELRRETLVELNKDPAQYLVEELEVPQAVEGMEQGPLLETQRPGNLTSQLSSMSQPDVKALIRE